MLPILLFWLPRGDEFGHVALLTDRYYISFWPFQCKEMRFSEVSVSGRLHFHVSLDYLTEGIPGHPRGPTSLHEIVNVTNEDINRVYEEFLQYNGIHPADVSLVAAENYNRRAECFKILSRTRYSLVGDVIVDKRIDERSYSDLLFFVKRCLTPGWGNIDICPNCIQVVTAHPSTSIVCPFYHKVQSCVSFCFNLIEMADPRPLVCLIEARNKTRKNSWNLRGPILFLGSGGICQEITVPNFEKHVVQKYWKTNCQRSHYKVFDFQKRTRLLLLSENIFKKVLMVAPTMFVLTWLLDFFDCSYLVLFGLTWIIHLMWFVLLYGAQFKLFPTVRLPKVVAFLGGIPCTILLFRVYFLLPTKNNLFDLEMDGIIQKLIEKLIPNIINFWSFLWFVEISELILSFLLDLFID